MVRIPITMCHGIGMMANYPLTPDHLDRLVKIAAELNFESIDYNQLFHGFEKEELPPRPIMFDFDHPVKSMCYEIHGVLSKYGLCREICLSIPDRWMNFTPTLCRRIPLREDYDLGTR